MASYIENITAQDVRDITGLPSSDITDAQIVTILSGAVAQLNMDIQITYSDWRVRTIDSWRQNKIDGSNAVFYVPDDKRPLGDRNSDGKLDANDIVAYTITPSGGGASAATRTEVTVSEITDDELGKITLASAPGTSSALYFSWASTPLEIETPHPLIKRALAQITAAMSYSRIDVGKLSKYKVGKVTVMQQSEGFKKYMDDYKQTVFQIKSRAVKRKDHDTIFAFGRAGSIETTIQTRRD